MKQNALELQTALVIRGRYVLPSYRELRGSTVWVKRPIVEEFHVLFNQKYENNRGIERVS